MDLPNQIWTTMRNLTICLKVKVAKQTYVRSTNDYHRGQNKEVGKNTIHTTDVYSKSKRYTIETQKMKLKKKRYGIKENLKLKH